MKLLALIVAVVLAILAAVLGWNVGPHHSFALLALALAALAVSFAIEQVPRS